jgi:hypothetical protein
MSIKILGTTVIDNSRNVNVGIITGTRLDIPPSPIVFSPSNGATGVAGNPNIVITFNCPIAKGSGNITLRSGSAAGTVIETIAVSSASVTISGSVATIDPVSTTYGSSVVVYTVVDAGAFTGITTTSTNAIIDTYSFTTASGPALGSLYLGGYLICCASPTRWVVAPSSSEVSRDWYTRGDANTRAQAVSGCTGWFVPTCGQLQNPGYACRVYWDSYVSTSYWSDSQGSFQQGGAFPWAQYVCLSNGSYSQTNKTNIKCVRSFRCVAY